ncbi:hypothetical protein, partial [Klebsiella pneumoniae]|uniref:hypothetical protein n=1 Tax=Klebsiella pneumoniae TaxID=573 RepID=UPI002117C5F1
INHSQFCFRGILWFSHKIAPYSVGCPTFGVQSIRLRGPTLFNLWGTRRPDKEFMPPSGTTAGTVSDVYRPAALRLRGPTLFEPVEDPQAG